MMRARAVAAMLLTIGGAVVAEDRSLPREVAVWRATLGFETSDGPRKVHYQTTRIPAPSLTTMLRTSGECAVSDWPDDTDARLRAANLKAVRLDDAVWTVENAQRTRRGLRRTRDLALTRPIFDESGTRALLFVLTSDFTGDLLEADLSNGAWTIRRCSSWFQIS